MAEIEITGREVIVHVTGVDRILALKSSITIPLEQSSRPNRTSPRPRSSSTAYGCRERRSPECW